MITVDIQSSAGGAPVVDLIVPVYRGLAETRRCLDSVLAFPQQTSHEIVVIDDCSPEPELTAWLRELAETGTITLLENPVNTGFVNAVNRGMVLHPDRDVVLLNSDTEVHGDWLDRLRRSCHSDPMIGTVTPFSNNATICSYPRFMQDNPLPEGWPLAKLDALFADVNAGQTVDIPTAVGFCMYITRRCLEQVGYFDATLFKRGYGEENDFSMRALEVGFRHLLAAMCSSTIAAEFPSAWKVRICARKLSAFWSSDIRIISHWWATIALAIQLGHCAGASIAPGWRARRTTLAVYHAQGRRRYGETRTGTGGAAGARLRSFYPAGF